MQSSLDRFITAHEKDFQKALSEVEAGKKQSHWMWYIFPQLKGLGRSDTAIYYGLDSLAEAAAFLQHPLPGQNLIRISSALLTIEGKTAYSIFGSPDDLKLHSCMTLFAQLSPGHPVFHQVLDQYFSGKEDERTLELLKV
ncbi:MAG: DUF1810 domain-containing protein [Chitinophagaceae bacterium]|nr:MAG: DUF1810 domain-containing protein [Chitinophagaceae bacterium]